MHNTNTKSNYFIITSHGWSGSNWLAYNLNLHPQITCGHSGAAIIAGDPNYINFLGLKKNFKKIVKGCVQRQSRTLLDNTDSRKWPLLMGGDGRRSFTER